MRSLIVALCVTVICGAGVVVADGSCPYQGQDYMNGSDVCQAGSRYRCENSVWRGLGIPCALESVLSDAGCKYLGQSYPSGRVSCQSGMQQRCESGAWQSLGTHCGDLTVVAYNGYATLPVDQRGCSFGGADFQPQSVMCRDGSTFICEGGGWTDQGAACN